MAQVPVPKPSTCATPIMAGAARRFSAALRRRSTSLGTSGRRRAAFFAARQRSKSKLWIPTDRNPSCKPNQLALVTNYHQLLNNHHLMTTISCQHITSNHLSTLAEPQVVEMPLPTGVRLERSSGGKASTAKAAELLSQAPAAHLGALPTRLLMSLR